jgi:hypothetical protein
MVVGLSDAMLSGLIALATLAGAAVGGVIAAVVTLEVEKRRDARNERRVRNEERAAARQVWLELEDARWTLATSLDDEVWRATNPSTGAWKEHRGRLASFLPLEDWLLVAKAVAAVEWERGHPQEVGDPLTDLRRRESVQDSRDRIVGAMESLKPHLDETPPPI